MKMNKLFIGMMISSSVFFVACSGGGEQSSEAETETMESAEGEMDEASAEDFSVDASASKVMWRGEMLGLYSHEGVVDFTEASIEMENGELTGGSFTVDLTSITPTDEAYNPEEGRSKEKLVGHLSSADFFAVDSFPTATFVIESVDGQTATGTMTIRGTSNQETVENITMMDEDGKKVLMGTLKFNRMNYDVSFEMPVADKVLSEEIQLNIKLVSAS
jgi:polyisoprenoid-binding protein YceI